jgi:hypothetical protein
MRIIGNNLAAVSLDIEAIEYAIQEHFARKNAISAAQGIKPRLGQQEKMITEMMDTVRNVIAPQIEEQFRLDLSDSTITREVSIPARRAQKIRLELKAAGIIWFPKWSRPKKKGDYPYWMAVMTFIVFTDLVKKTRMPKTSKTYNQQYCDLYDQAVIDLFSDQDLKDACWTIREFMVGLNKILNGKIEALGLTKADLVK